MLMPKRKSPIMICKIARTLAVFDMFIRGKYSDVIVYAEGQGQAGMRKTGSGDNYQRFNQSK